MVKPSVSLRKTRTLNHQLIDETDLRDEEGSKKNTNSQLAAKGFTRSDIESFKHKSTTHFGTMTRPSALHFDAFQLFISPGGYGERAKFLIEASWQKKKLSETRKYKQIKALKWLHKLELKLKEYYAHYFQSYHENWRFNLPHDRTNMGSVASQITYMMSALSQPSTSGSPKSNRSAPMLFLDQTSPNVLRLQRLSASTGVD